jgi:hypothetical protein
MGFWDSVKKYFAFETVPERVRVDFTRFEDGRLRELWKEEKDLTDEARVLLIAEMRKRGLEGPDVAPPKTKDAAPPPMVVIEAPHEGTKGNIVKVDGRAGVLLATTAGRWLLVHMPSWDPAPVSLDEPVPLDGIVVCNGDARGWLHTQVLAQAANVPAERIWSLASGPVDRVPGASSGAATLFPRDVLFGNLRLRRHRRTSSTFHASWRGSPAKAAVGAMLPELLAQGNQGLNIFAGTLPARSTAWELMLVAALGAAGLELAYPTGKSKGPTVVLAGGCVGGPLRWFTRNPTGLGFHISGGDTPVGPDAVNALGCLLADRWDLAEAALPAAASDVEDLVEHLIVEGRTEDALRLAKLRTDVPVVTATALAARGSLPEALAALERAEGKNPQAMALRAHLLLAQRSLGEARAAAHLAVMLDPYEPLAVDAFVRTFMEAGLAEDARELLGTTPLRGPRLNALYALLDKATPAAPGAAGPYREPAARMLFPTLADRALATRPSTKEHGERLRARARALDPTLFSE